MKKTGSGKTAVVFRFVAIAITLAVILPSCGSSDPKVGEKTWSNQYPVILLHGFAGWGRDEVFGIYYWGGFQDIQEMLKTEHNYNTMTAVVGPFSSTWDRTCELYAQLVGTKVGYGKAHSEKYGHLRYGDDYTGMGLYPRWSTVSKIHIVGHSMGGTTARDLVYLMKYGDKDERDNTPADELSPLFLGGNEGWVASISTIATPHDGTTLLEILDLKVVAQSFLSILSMMIGENPIYDLKLEQWGLQREPGEKWNDYLARVFSSPIWNSTDFSTYDLSVDGASLYNQTWLAQPDIYYFSYANKTTWTLFGNYEYPDLNTIFAFYPTAWAMGTFDYSRCHTSKEWHTNDGIVNTVGMPGPHCYTDSSFTNKDIVVNYTGNPKKGEWNYVNLLDEADHAAVINIFFFPDHALNYYDTTIKPRYVDIVKRVVDLEGN